MVLYVRFMFCLAFGLVGLGMVLMWILDELFGNWNAAHALHSEVSTYMEERARLRRENAGVYAAWERTRRETSSAEARLMARREQLNEIASVERRLHELPPTTPVPGALRFGVIVTPLPRLVSITTVAA